VKKEWPWLLAFAIGVALDAANLLWVFYLTGAVALAVLALSFWLTRPRTIVTEIPEEVEDEGVSQ
jgi:hypothetical protein